MARSGIVGKPSFVFGIEGQGDWADISSSRVSIYQPGVLNPGKVDAIGLITGQIGYAWNNSLFYFKGGAAVDRRTV